MLESEEDIQAVRDKATKFLEEYSKQPFLGILKYFQFAHLPPVLIDVSETFATLALHIAMELPANEERTIALRKLLEAKDAAVRSALP